MNEPELAELYEAAAHTSINRRCALAYLHDARGGMQALFSAIELLSRCARAGTAQLERIDRANDLARRAIGNHENALLAAMQVLTAQPAALTPIDLTELVREATRFLRGEASGKDLALTVEGDPEVIVLAERGRLYTLLVGLLNCAIDDAAAQSALTLTVSGSEAEAHLVFATDAGFNPQQLTREWWNAPPMPPSPADLTLLFAHRVIAEYGGKLRLVHGAGAGALHVTLPRIKETIAGRDPATLDR